MVGIGVNIEWVDVPEELTEIATACNLEGGRPVDRHDLLDAFLGRYSRWLSDLDAADVAYEDRLLTVGRRVRVEQADRVLTGVATGVDEAGRLLLRRDDGVVETIAVGDVIHLRDE